MLHKMLLLILCFSSPRVVSTALATGKSLHPSAEHLRFHHDRHADKLAHKIYFDRRGYPMIAIRVGSLRQTAVIKAAKGELVATCSAPKQQTKRRSQDLKKIQGQQVQIDARVLRSPTRRWRVELARFRPNESLIEATRIKWQERLSLLEVSPRRPAPSLQPNVGGLDANSKTKSGGLQVITRQVGSLYGIGTETFDNRELLIFSQPFSSRADALVAAEYYQQKGWISEIRLRPEQDKEGHIVLYLSTGGRPQTSSDSIRVHADRSNLLIKIDDGAWLSVGTDVALAKDDDGSIAVIRHLPVDKVLLGIVPREIFPSAPDGALEAQTIAARTDLLSKLGRRHLSSPYDVCNLSHCQNFVTTETDTYPRILKAIRSTRGQVLVDRHYGRLVPALYSAHCGGHSESNQLIWRGMPHPSLQGHTDTWCTRNPSKYNKWQRKISDISFRP